MINTEDLHIEQEIRPLFDLTHNSYSGQELSNLLAKTLHSKVEILARQQLLKGFISNHVVLKDYSYYRFNLSDIYEFLDTIFIGSISPWKLKMRFMFSEKAREQKRGKLILMVRLFYAINKDYLSKLDIKAFPKTYAAELEGMKKFFADFDLDRYETAFIKKKFRVKHIVELILIVMKKTANGELAQFWKRWFLFEAYLSISNYISSKNFVFPEFDDSKFLLENFYHPILKNPVKNNFTAQTPVVLLTGPNMSGKSTLLKAVSICVYLAHAGLAVPASKAVMPFYDSLSVAINLTDSIVSGYSHFMSEVITLKNVLTDAGKGAKCFAVFDELFRGTNIEDALEISTTTIRGLNKFNGSLFLISTHLHQLKEMVEIKTNKIPTCSIDCKLTDNVPVFTYKLRAGWNDLKLGRILFEKEGLDKMLNGMASENI
jgi:DNA mismatch repair protein MutS